MHKYETVFSFDFDNTISRDPETFLRVMELLELQGHTIYIITGRMETTYPEDLDFLKEKGYKVIFTNHQPKKEYVKNFYNIDIDVWVDDKPEAILEPYDGPATTYRQITEAV